MALVKDCGFAFCLSNSTILVEASPDCLIRWFSSIAILCLDWVVEKSDSNPKRTSIILAACTSSFSWVSSTKDIHQVCSGVTHICIWNFCLSACTSSLFHLLAIKSWTDLILTNRSFIPEVHEHGVVFSVLSGTKDENFLIHSFTCITVSEIDHVTTVI